jgi:hypothetical protein
MPAPIQAQPVPATPGIDPSVVATATSVQLARLGQATRSGQGTTFGSRVVTGTGYITSTDTWIGADTSGGACTQYLPLVSAYRANGYEVEQYVAGNTFTVACQGSDTIDGSATLSVTKRVAIHPILPGLYHAVVIGT